MLDQDVPVQEWKLYADKFKQLCLSNGLGIDPAVTADKARILRCPDTLNFKLTETLKVLNTLHISVTNRALERQIVTFDGEINYNMLCIEEWLDVTTSDEAIQFLHKIKHN